MENSRSSESTFRVTPLTRVRRQPKRGSYEKGDAFAILDEGLVASVGFAHEGQPLVLPMAYSRDAERLILHAATSSRFGHALANGARLCVTVTLLDGIVLARSAMHHSLNYRSVVVLGSAVELTTRVEKLAALAALVDHVSPGRSAECRPPNELELRATRVFAVALEEVSVKRRSGDPCDDADDLELPYWAGVIPLEQRAMVPIADTTHAPRADVPSTASGYTRCKS
jgi:uncharacterized protein